MPSADVPDDMIAARVRGVRAIVLLSGGLDSTTALAWAIDQGFSCYPVTFAYGQRHHAELMSARAVVLHYGLTGKYHALGLPSWGGSALTDTKIAVPHARSPEAMSADIPPTYVPARNTILLSYALALAEIKRAKAIIIGVNALDYSGYPDCRPEFIRAFNDMAKLATKRAVEDGAPTVLAPLMTSSKADIIRLATRLEAPLHLTHSCYDPVSVPIVADLDEHHATLKWLACGTCDSCILRRNGFEEAGVPDPTLYAESVA